jgi:hypothetical protein
MVLHEMANAMRSRQPDAGGQRRWLAMLDPDLLYASPSDVLVDFSLSRADKIALLRNWKHGLESRSVAREEGMVGREEGLGREIAMVSSALERLEHR